MSAVSEEQVGAVGRLLINPARPLKERFRALFTLKNIGGPLALDWIIKVGVQSVPEKWVTSNTGGNIEKI
jgi:hypothetical protein